MSQQLVPSSVVVEVVVAHGCIVIVIGVAHRMECPGGGGGIVMGVVIRSTSERWP